MGKSLHGQQPRSPCEPKLGRIAGALHIRGALRRRCPKSSARSSVKSSAVLAKSSVLRLVVSSDPEQLRGHRIAPSIQHRRGRRE
ncbi:hypothetical protein [Methylobacterium sp. 4-46]|uniref:hypothetical protein n=1 Tax=Methylobacterium sp. (strain 4-46) TaxID=426117 RepID=UPI0012373B61|nr:hypothetical protein [Methylobacterium sp. 4-46]